MFCKFSILWYDCRIILLKICFNVFHIVNLNENMSKFRIELTTL